MKSTKNLFVAQSRLFCAIAVIALIIGVSFAACSDPAESPVLNNGGVSVPAGNNPNNGGNNPNNGGNNPNNGGYPDNGGIYPDNGGDIDYNQTKTFGNFEYYIHQDFVSISKYTGNEASVIIPDQIDGIPVTVIGERAFIFCTSLTGIDIPNSVTSIGDRAFYGCTNLAAVNIGDSNAGAGSGGDYSSCTSIGDYAFQGCGLIRIEIPQSVTRIGANAFSSSNLNITWYYNPALLIDNNPALSNNFFRTHLKDVFILSVTSIGGNAFKDCTGLASVTIGNSVNSIGDYAFSGCSQLTLVYFGVGVKTIGSSAFIDTANTTSLSAAYSIQGGGEYFRSSTTSTTWAKKP